MKINDAPLGSTTSTENHQKTETVTVSCACNRDITLAELMAAYPQASKQKCEAFLPELNSTMSKYEITYCIRKAHFLAQVGIESGQLRYVAEILGVDKKTHKQSTDESRYGGYKGRGLIQITLKPNYVAYGKATGQDFLNANKVKLEEAKWATDSAGWFWAHGTGTNLNAYADENDFIPIVISINGGLNGYEDRLNLLGKVVAGLKVKLCPRLDVLFSTFSELAKFQYDAYPLEKSRAYDKPYMAYAWGEWHDANSKRKGTKKDAGQAKVGYVRFLELAPKKSILRKLKPTKQDQRRDQAEKRVKELDGSPAK